MFFSNTSLKITFNALMLETPIAHTQRARSKPKQTQLLVLGLFRIYLLLPFVNTDSVCICNANIIDFVYIGCQTFTTTANCRFTSKFLLSVMWLF